MLVSHAQILASTGIYSEAEENILFCPFFFPIEDVLSCPTLCSITGHLTL